MSTFVFIQHRLQFNDTIKITFLKMVCRSKKHIIRRTMNKESAALEVNGQSSIRLEPSKNSKTRASQNYLEEVTWEKKPQMSKRHELKWKDWLIRTDDDDNIIPFITVNNLYLFYHYIFKRYWGLQRIIHLWWATYD